MMAHNKQVLFLTSYPPRECGIATFTQDLIASVVKKFSKSFAVAVCALHEQGDQLEYPAEVKYILDTSNPHNYTDLAAKINSEADIACVCIEHEFGLHSGKYGENLLYFIENCKKPVITTFHTVLPNADSKMNEVVSAISKHSEKIVVLTGTSARILEKEYGINPGKIKVIPHGTHLLSFSEDEKSVKEKYKFSDRRILSTFGLLSENKSIETVLDALPAIKKHYPDVLYLLLGKTHPGIVKREGERYREKLERKIKELNLEDNVLFVNKYLSLNELLEYLTITDIYLFTSKDPNQAVSGTFAYAMASGCPIIATRIPHTAEMLNEGTGILVDFENPEQVARAAIKLLGDDHLRNNMSLNAYHQTRVSTWENISIRYGELFYNYINKDGNLVYNYPEISLRHLDRMTTADGMIQFSILEQPDYQSGYTLDDNARALISVTKLFRLTNERSLLKKIYIYLNFIEKCQQDDGRFLNYIDYEGNFTSQNQLDNLSDANGRAVWALGYYIFKSHDVYDRFNLKAENVFVKTLAWAEELTSPRAIAFTIKGLYYYNIIHKNVRVKSLIQILSKRLLNNYYDNFDHQWEWFEPYLTYANSALPEAMLLSYLSSGDEAYKIIAKDSFDFLISKIFSKKSIKVISNNGWHHRDSVANRFGEQPIDVSYAILTLQLFYEVFKEEKYRQHMQIAFSWFLGNNHLKQMVYNPVTGGCCDGLEENNINLNQGAESTVCYLMARIAMEEIENAITDTETQSRRKLLLQSTLKQSKHENINR